MKKIIFVLLLFPAILTAQEIPVFSGAAATTTQITWKWYQVPSATGYKINTTSNYATAVDLGTDTVDVEAGLTPNTTYTRYVWAYNACGHGSPLEMSRKTLDDFVCGNNVTIGHVAGTIAPVTKTVTYATTEVTGEADKCWIKKNLGATSTPTSRSDTTEAAAGWYWQFNRKQGYKYGGSRVPASGWSYIDENSSWITGNDPCQEIGEAWRLPTSTEWNNVDIANSWSWSSVFSGSLKLHAAGSLNYLTGERESAGTSSIYWASNQGMTSHSFILLVSSGGVGLNSYQKSFGGSVRCIKEIEEQEVGCENPPEAPTTGTHVATTSQITWKWNASDGATGYKWGTTTSYAAATQMSSSVQKIETGLSPGTGYTRYVWAYNDCGASPYLTITDTTPESGWACGDDVTVSHLAGSISPVSVQITYGTVYDNETGECWIAQNLGASTQASSINDNTKESSGWYWQFNKKQGYDMAASRTPVSQWVSDISESSSWLATNDPCQSLGVNWRLPTQSEWETTISSNSWSNMDSAFLSDLKLHSAGRLYYSAGTLAYRGQLGYYWSSTQYDSQYGKVLYLAPSSAKMNNMRKSYGYSVRCLID